MSAESFVQQQLFAFQLFDAPFIAGNKGLAFALHEATQKGFDLGVDLGEASPDLHPHVFTFGSSTLREGVQFFDKPFEGLRVWRYSRNEIFKVSLKLGAADGFAIAGAAFLGAEIIGMFVARFARGPAGRQRSFAIRTDHKAAQREVGAYILSGGRFRPGAQEVLDFLECGERDQSFMLSFAEGDAPTRQFQIRAHR